MKPSVARTTYGARTDPRGVRTTPGSIESAGVRSWRATPRRVTTSARPRTSRAGWIAAQSGVYVAPRVRVARSRSPASAGESTWSPYSARARASWAWFRASTMVPPLAKWQSIPSARVTRWTSSTEARIAASCASPSDVGNSAEHQPPLRPEAPKPATSASTTTIRSVGSASER